MIEQYTAAFEKARAKPGAAAAFALRRAASADLSPVPLPASLDQFDAEATFFVANGTSFTTTQYIR